jgi:hypothetical protein
MSSVDTVAFRFNRPLPPPEQLRDDGWQPRYHSILGFVDKWVNKPVKGSHDPNLTWSEHDGGAAWVTAESSFPKLINATNTRDLTDADLPRALDTVSSYVSQKTRADCDTRRAIIGRVDYADNFHVGEPNIQPYLEAALSSRLPHFRRPFREGETTVTIATKSSRTIQLYAKLDEVVKQFRQGKADGAAVKAAIDILRFETRYRTTMAVTRLAKKLKVERTAADLLTQDTAERVISMEVKQLSLDKPIEPPEARMTALLEAFGDAKVAAELFGFLALRDAYGDDFWRIPQFNMSRPTYNRSVKKLKAAGLWLTAPEGRQLPPLRVARGRASKAA